MQRRCALTCSSSAAALVFSFGAPPRHVQQCPMCWGGGGVGKKGLTVRGEGGSGGKRPRSFTCHHMASIVAITAQCRPKDHLQSSARAGMSGQPLLRYIAHCIIVNWYVFDFGPCYFSWKLNTGLSWAVERHRGGPRGGPGSLASLSGTEGSAASGPPEHTMVAGIVPMSTSVQDPPRNS